ncbi:hypothetical protein D9619_010593 [Psilocybe cf. subviscida]|uniref:Uncharacterized protein n=1 Tax=Psilocybe cf. subviscida TaxID=2480587 RepID=A0A8H5ASR9_9AGAR|nr:hypothetical protein D9619_010593 [Psilocybe cf. subviscida]
MSFSAGDFTPFPVSTERSESPPPELDEEYPFIGVELTVSGLPRTSFCSATEHLQLILSHLCDEQHEILPELQIHSPQQATALNTDPLDYVYVSLAGPLRTVPRPDILERVRVLIDQQEGPNICRMEGYRIQRSYIPKNSDRIYFLFESEESVRRLIAKPPIINNQSLWAHPARFIQPIFGLEVAINGVGPYPNAQSIIDRYIERKYGEGIGERIVRRSRVEMDGSVYCAVLLNPTITAKFLRDDFDVFKDFGAIPTGKPQYLYLLNCEGIPSVGYSTRNTASASESQNPLLQRQVDALTSEIRTQNSGLMELARVQQRMQEDAQRREERQSESNANMFLYFSSSNLLTDASNNVTNIQTNLNNARQLLLFAPGDGPRQFMENQVTDLSGQLKAAQQERSKRLSEFVSIQARGTLANPGPLSQSSSMVEEAGDQGNRAPKRARVEGSAEAGDMETEDDVRAQSPSPAA